MKILAICGSPHKGNSLSTLDSIRESNPDIEFKTVMLKDMDLKMCRGCYGCVLLGEDKCPLKDDRDSIVKEMLDADGLIIAAPTYTLQVPALTKNFFDRLGYFGHRPVFYDKFAMVVATGGGYGIEDARKYMVKGLTGFGFNVVSTLDLQTLPKKIMSEKMMTDNQKATAMEFEKFISRIRKGGRIKPSIELVVVFNLFKAVSMAFPEVYKADYEFYRDKADFYYDVKIPFYKKKIAQRYVQKVMKD